jgi:hypothetical protein
LRIARPHHGRWRAGAESRRVSTLLLDPPQITGDPILLHAFARRDRPLATTDLIRAMTGTGAMLSDVVEALARALADGLLGPHGYSGNARLYELTDEGRRLLAADREADEMSRIRWMV